MNRKGVQSIWKKSLDIDLSDNSKTNLLIFVTVEPSGPNESKIYYSVCVIFPIMSNKGNRYIEIMHVYGCN